MAKWPGAVAKCDYGPGACRSDPRKRVEFGDSCPIEDVQTGRGYRRRIGSPAAEREVRRQSLERRLPYSCHPVETGDAAERPPPLAIRHDPPGQLGTHAGEALELAHSGAVGVNPLVGAERCGEPQRAVAMGERVAVGGRVEEGDGPVGARRRPGRGTHQVAADTESEDEEEGATLGGGHAGKLPRRMSPRCVTEMRSGTGERRTENGVLSPRVSEASEG